MTTINLDFGFNVPRHVIYQALVQPQLIMQYTRARAVVDAREGGAFEMLEGKIVGKFLTLRAGQYIKMQWKFNDWKQYSVVEIILEDPEEDECDVKLIHSKIPSSEKKQKIEYGWKEIFFTPMSKILGYPNKD